MNARFIPRPGIAVKEELHRGHVGGRVTSGGGAACPRAVVGLLPCKAACLFPAFACPWTLPSPFDTPRDVAPWGVAPFGSPITGCWGEAGQHHLHCGPLMHAGRDLHCPAVLLDQAIHLAEPQAGALADLLGGEKGF